MNNKIITAASLLILSATASTSASETTTLEDLISLNMPETQIIHKSDSISVSGILNEGSTIIGDQIVQNRNIINAEDSRIAITSIVDVDTMGSIDKVGRALTEVMMHEMQVRGFRVVDFKVTDFISVRGNGDSIFSRDISKLNKEEDINYILAGTYTKHIDGIVLNMRLIDMSDHVVVSSAQATIPRRFMDKLTQDYSTADVGVIEAEVQEVVKPIHRAPDVETFSVQLK
mgnify:FL=1